MLRIVRQILGQRLIDGQGPGSAHRKVVAVRLSPRDRRSSNIAASAGLVLDDKLVAQRRAHLVQDETGHNVARASCREGHDNAYGTIRVRLCQYGGAEKENCGDLQQTPKSPSSMHHVLHSASLDRFGCGCTAAAICLT